ncbi:FAD-binding oxidoreductase [bacterium]|nr:FAD-binding oxidoreductase [bacterium]
MNFSYWEHKSLFNSVDYLVVGMGLTGLQTALNFKEQEPLARVVVCDRFAWSLGASTRNAGFACFANVSEIIDDLEHHSPQEVYTLAADRYKGLQVLRQKFGDERIGYEEKGSVEIFTSKNRSDLEKGIDFLQIVNSELYRYCNLDGVFYFSSNSKLPGVIGGIHNKYEGQLHTGKLYSSIMDECRAKGIELWGGLTVESWEESSDGVETQFKEGLKIKSSQLLLCTNAFTSKLSDVDVTPARGQVIVTEKLDHLPCEGLHHFDQGYYYWRDIDGRILLGGARNMDPETENTDEIEANVQIQDELKRFMFEQICGKEVKIEHEWSGIMGMGKGKKKNPIIESLSPHVHAAVRLGGMGVALSALISEKLVRKMKGN